MITQYGWHLADRLHTTHRFGGGDRGKASRAGVGYAQRPLANVDVHGWLVEIDRLQSPHAVANHSGGSTDAVQVRDTTVRSWRWLTEWVSPS